MQKVKIIYWRKDGKPILTVNRVLFLSLRNIHSFRKAGFGVAIL